ncbi:MFS transporter [Zestomonas carbonaria]|uniref:Major facilitator superfamily (MFS) profile domain-containing protein n=1 Tax=Zestomonas carbonaria TaxID=2762745 RepID=A0A7U7EQ80_9GAMM|nr:MFS transporter [Pseudomonas carbonaria]CAD5109159.1 hypothetical protein PSEWESI4_03455 [Pseudomonas carbonaria]
MSTPLADTMFEPVVPEGDRERRRREFATIGLVSVAHGSSHFFQLLLAPLFPWLMAEFDLGFTQVGLAMTLFFVISGAGQAVAGFAVDRFGPGRVLMFGESCLVLSGLALAAAPGYAGLFLAAALAGTGNAVYHPAGFTVLNRRLSEARLGHGFAMHGLAGNLGWALAPALLTGVAAWANWRLAALVASALALAILLLLVWQRRLLAVPTTEHSADDPAPTTFAFLGVPAVWLCFAFFFCTATAFGAFQNFGGPVLREVYGMSLASAASAVSLFLFSGAVGVVAGGFLAARGGAHERQVACILLAAALLAVLLASAVLPPALAPLLMALIGFCNGLANPSRDLLVRRAAVGRFGHRAFGRIYGLVYSGLDAGMALSPLLFGLFMDAGRFALVLLGVALLQVAATLTALGVGRQR